jgi:hypothetical protein
MWHAVLTNPKMLVKKQLSSDLGLGKMATRHSEFCGLTAKA